MRKIFINDFGRLRSGWRALIFTAGLFATLFVVVMVLRVFYLLVESYGPRIPYVEFIADTIYRLMLLGAALLVGFVCARALEGLPWRSLGVSFHQGWFRDLAIGFALGFAALAIAVGIAAAAGGLRFSFHAREAMGEVVKTFIGTTPLLFVAALAEEAIFRGYPLQTFTRAKLAWVGVLLTLAFFGYVHLANPNAMPGMTFINTALAGLWLAVAYLRTRSLWFPLGMHWSWNWALGWFFGLPVSGINLAPDPLLKGHDLGPAWLTGASYGIEGGVAATVAIVLVTIFTWRTRWVSATPEMMKLTNEENPALSMRELRITPAEDAV